MHLLVCLTLHIQHMHTHTGVGLWHCRVKASLQTSPPEEIPAIIHGFSIWISFWSTELIHNSSKCTGILVISTFSQKVCNTTGGDNVTVHACSAWTVRVNIPTVKNWLVWATVFWRQTIPELGTHCIAHRPRWGYVRYECGGFQNVKAKQ